MSESCKKREKAQLTFLLVKTHTGNVTHFLSCTGPEREAGDDGKEKSAHMQGGRRENRFS